MGLWGIVRWTRTTIESGSDVLQFCPRQFSVISRAGEFRDGDLGLEKLF